MNNTLQFTAITLISLTLTACGGDNDGGLVVINPTAAPTSQPTAEPTTEPSEGYRIEENYPGYCGVDGAVENEHSAYTGSGYLNTNNATGASAQWRITVPSRNTYTLEWRYAAASGNHSATATSATDTGNVEFIATGAWDSWSTDTVTLQLDAGDNTIDLSATTAGGLPNIDYMNVHGSGIEPLNCDGTSAPAWLVHPTPNSDCVAGATFSNEVVDCGGARIGLSCSGDSESQPPVITLNNATIKHLILVASGGSDGIHCTAGDCVLENVIWEDICEDAATMKAGSTMTISGGWAFNGNGGWGGNPDKIFQHNDINSTVTINNNFTAKGRNGKLYRSCGNCTNNGGPRHVIIDDVRIEGAIGSIVGINSNTGYNDTATITHLSIENYSAGSPQVCVEYSGVDKSEGSSTKIGERWNTANCVVSQSDVSAL